MGRTYIVYGISLVLSTAMNYYLVASLEMEHRYAWASTMILVGVFNYFLVSKYAFAGTTPVSIPSELEVEQKV